jgi:hypothetical protein
MLEAEGAGTYTQRAIPGSEPSQDCYAFRCCAVVDQVVTVKPGCRGVPGAGSIEGMARAAQAAEWSKTRGGRAHRHGGRGGSPGVRQHWGSSITSLEDR